MSIFRSKSLLIGGALVMAGAAALKNRQKVAGLIGARSSVPEPPPFSPPKSTSEGPRAVPTPQPANYDAPGPPENTATPVPAPDPLEPEAIDEEAEIAAAAAEAANIGGSVSDYAGPELGEHADEEIRAVVEGGGGEAEGFEQAEADLARNAESPEGGAIPAAERLDEIIEAQDNPAVGEIVEPHETAATGEADEAVEPETLSVTGERNDDQGLAGGGAVSPTHSTVTRFFDERKPEAGTSETPVSGDPAEAEAEAAKGEDDKDGKDGDDSSWQTWSGQAS